MNPSHTLRSTPKAVMFGAGNIGRGFIGQLFYTWGFQTTFIDIDSTLVEQLNQRRAYPITLLHADSDETCVIRNVSALNASNSDAAAAKIAEADLMGVSVGTHALPVVMKTLAKGIALRFEHAAPPLNILICENLLGAQAYLRSLLLQDLPAEAIPYFDRNIGLVETSIGRMIPTPTPEMKTHDPLQIFAESYCVLPADRDAFKGGVPDYPGLQPCAPFSFYVKRKMLIHNMGHAVAAYLGYEQGYTYIWEAIEDAKIRATVQKAMAESAEALSRAYSTDVNALYTYADDLLIRFANRKLGDTIIRVGRDLPRKLGENERLFSAARLCQEQGVSCDHILFGIQAALFFREGEHRITLDQLRKMADIVIGVTTV